MTFDSSVFFQAFKTSGMLAEVTYQPPAGAAVIFMAGFVRPAEIVLDGMVHTTDFTIEYQSKDVTLQRGNQVSVKEPGASVAETYRVRATPAAKGDGFFTVASLEKVSP
ncbi:MAG TPA: hypothetical protein VEC06_08525 [Paucimonas sp.]|nr:hypothetical protein [Paucimonas sp.]